MKKILISLVTVMVIGLSSCDVNSEKMENFEPHDITYYKDSRTGICYAVVASRTSGSTDQTGLGMTVVPCDKVKDYLEQ